MRPTRGAYLTLGAIAACLALFIFERPGNAAPDASAAGPAAGTAAYVDFTAKSLTTLPAGFTAMSFTPHRPADFHVTQTAGQRVLTDDPGPAGDVLYFTGAGAFESLEESYSFLYSGPDSIVEPFIVNAHPKRPGAVGGFVTDLALSAPGSKYKGGCIVFRYTDEAGRLQNVIQGRLRTEPYFYQNAHTYRVDAIADGVTGLLTSRIYDVALGSQTFDVSIKTLTKGAHVFPGVIARLGRVAMVDFAFGPAGGLPPLPVRARRAEEYMNYLGYNAATSGPVTAPGPLAFAHYFPLLLIRHVRVPDEWRFLPAINAVAQYGIDADVLTGNRTTIDGLRRFNAALTRPPDAIELWNEPNNPSMGDSHDANYGADLPPFAAAVAQAFPNIKRWGPSVLPNHDGYPSDAATLLRTVGPYITAWNAHSYTMGTPENLGYGGFYSQACGPSLKEDCGWYGAPNYNDNESAVINPALPGVTTEGAASFGTYPDICGHAEVDAATQQAYVERGMLYNFKLGHLRIFPYKFIDDGGCSDGGGTFGIMSKIIEPAGGVLIVPKPAFTSLVYFNHILADTGTQAKTFEPQPLLYALRQATPDVQSVLLAESDGSYRLVLWSDAALWNFNANGLHAVGSAVPLVTDGVAVAFAKPTTATVYTQVPGTGIWSAAQRMHSASIDVTVNQYPIVVAIGPQASVDQKIILPRDVPTPGPLETWRPKRSAQSNLTP